MLLNKLLARHLREMARKLENNTCEMSDEEKEQFHKLIAHYPISKSEAYSTLKISRSKFDSLVRDGILPEGKKRMGFNELAWYKDEIENYKLIMEQKNEQRKEIN